jgi:hypothetical protein
LPAFFFPPLAFFAIVRYPPLHVGFCGANAPAIDPVAAAWHAHPVAAFVASGHLLRTIAIGPTRSDVQKSEAA